MRLRVISVVALSLAVSSCDLVGPSPAITGLWVAPTGKFSYVCVSLQQNGDDITGTASAFSEIYLLYRGAPVHGEHPDVQFTVGATNTEPCCQHLAGTTFFGRQDSTGDIVGRYGRVDIRFKRSDLNTCETARTAP